LLKAIANWKIEQGAFSNEITLALVAPFAAAPGHVSFAPG
jgi:hypothetical protein